MENGGGGGAKTAIRFGFSWADEVEREEREREQVATQQEPPRPEAKREQIKADPFGAARPREVVLAEKGVDWRARDRELDLSPAPRPPRSVARAHRRAAATAAEAAPGRANGTSAAACTVTPARGAPLDWDAGRTPHPRRQAAATPRPPPAGSRNAPSVGRSARGGSKRKFAGQGPERRSRPVGDHAEQWRRISGELNIGEERLFAAGNSCNCNPGGSQAEGMKAAVAVDAEGATSAAVAAIKESAAGQKRSRGGKGRKGRGSGKTKKQQTQPV